MCAALVLSSGCASEQKRTDRAVVRLQAAAVAFDVAYRRAPRSLAELEADAARTKPLDRRPFASVELAPQRGGGRPCRRDGSLAGATGLIRSTRSQPRVDRLAQQRL